MQDQETNTVTVPETRLYNWRLVLATCLGPPAAGILMHIPEYIKYPERTLTGIGIAMTIVGTLATLGLLIAILPKPEKHGAWLKTSLVAAALAASAGILIISRNQL